MELQRGQRLEFAEVINTDRPFVIAFIACIPDSTVDCVCFGLDQWKKVSDDRYVTFYNQPCTPCGGISLAAPNNGEGFEINLNAIPPSIDGMNISATMDGGKTFSQMLTGAVQITQSGRIVACFNLTGDMFNKEKTLILVEIYRKEKSWRFTARGQGFNGGLPALVQHFGVDTSNQRTPNQPPAPPVSLFTLDDFHTNIEETDQQKTISSNIEQTLSEFKVTATVVGIEPGPIVTTYSLLPAPGVKLSKVINLEKDLALALSKPGLRINPHFVHGVIGIEIPNKEREMVPLRRLLASDAYKGNDSPLLLPLGVTTTGKPVVENLESLPHLLVAGTTRSGKTIALHGIICGILFRTSPKDTRLLLVDPKFNEFMVYEGTPHLLASVITEPRKTVTALHWLTDQMEARYQQMSGIGVRNLEGWRKKAEAYEQVSSTTTNYPRIPDCPPLIVVIIDELADLILQSNDSLERPLVRLAQMGRAAGIHLILATQRPSREVLTPLIKANIPARLAFKVTSKSNSQIIIDSSGAENLLGRGDALFVAPGSDIQRVQAPMVSEENVAAIVRFLKSTLPYNPDGSLASAL